MNTQDRNEKSIKNPTQLPQWAELLKVKRLALGESQEKFGERFGVTKAAVSYWESATYEPPAPVLWWLMEGELHVA
jgi:transcriptional regulator with XRE-family HTH domain